MAGLSVSSPRPRIGVTLPDGGGEAMWLFTAWAVRFAGGSPRRITPSRPRDLEELDGLILCGGADVNPTFYGGDDQPALPRARPASLAWWRYALDWLVYPLAWFARHMGAGKPGRDMPRDRLEMRLCREALEAGKPILAICRGEQLLNVVLGGTLHADVSGFYNETPQVRSFLPRVTVHLEPGSRLAEVLGGEPCRVNALHNQAIARLGRGLRVTARDNSGVVQAIEDPQRPYVIGVQWHPEFLPQITRQRRLFAGLVAAATAQS